MHLKNRNGGNEKKAKTNYIKTYEREVVVVERHCDFAHTHSQTRFNLYAYNGKEILK